MLYKKWLVSKKPEGKIEYKRYTAVPKREDRKRYRESWDKCVRNLEHKTSRTEVYKILKEGRKDIKDTVKIHRNIDGNIFLQYC